MANLPSLPPPPSNTDPALRRFLDAVKSVLDAYVKPGNEVVTQSDLTTFSETVTESIVGSSTTPPILAGLTAYGGFSSVILTWDAIPYGDHAYTVIYRAAVDDQSQAAQIGTSRTLIYADNVPSSDTYYYWIRTVSKANVMGPFNAVAGTAGSASLDPTYSLEVLDSAITAQQIVAGTITADKMAIVQLAALTANMGTVTAGIMQSPDGSFIIDLTNKQILIAGPSGQASDDYTVIQNGVVESYKWTGSTHLLAKSLSLIESGIADNGSVVQIPGYFDSEPSIMVSPRSIKTFDATYSGQNQALQCSADNINEYATGQWEFTAVATLVFSDSSGSFSPNWANGDVSTSPINSPTYVLPSNSTQVTVNLQVKSFRGTGTAPYYYYRSVTWKLYYRVVGAGSWTLGDTKIKAIGSTLLYVTDSVTFDFPADDDYEFYVEATYSDATGTFSSGSGGYEYDQYTTAAITSYVTASGYSGVDDKNYLSATLESYTPPAGYAIYNVEYSYKYGYYLAAAAWPSYGLCTSKVSGISGCYKSLTASVSTGSGISKTDGEAGANNLSATISFTDSAYDAGKFSTGYAEVVTSNVSEGDSELRIADAKATIYIRKPIANSTTPVNDLKIDSYNYQLSGFSQISAGTLNWQAVGR